MLGKDVVQAPFESLTPKRVKNSKIWLNVYLTDPRGWAWGWSYATGHLIWVVSTKGENANSLCDFFGSKLWHVELPHFFQSVWTVRKIYKCYILWIVRLIQPSVRKSCSLPRLFISENKCNKFPTCLCMKMDSKLWFRTSWYLVLTTALWTSSNYSVSSESRKKTSSPKNRGRGMMKPDLLSYLLYLNPCE